MGRRKTEELQKHTLNLRSGDMEELGELHPNVQPSTFIRSLVSRYIDNERNKRQQRAMEIQE